MSREYFSKLGKSTQFWITVVLASLIVIGQIAGEVETLVVRGLNSVSSSSGVNLSAGYYALAPLWSWILTAGAVLLIAIASLSIQLYRERNQKSSSVAQLNQLNDRIRALSEEREKLVDTYGGLERAYNESCRSISRVLDQLGLRHHVSKIDYECFIFPDGDAEITERHTIFAVESAVHFWKSAIVADAEASGVSFLWQLDLDIKDITTTGQYETIYVAAADQPLRKELCVFFLPEIEPGESRTIERTYYWPGFLTHFIDGKEVEFWGNYKTAQTDGKCNLNIKADFHRDIGEVKCENHGMPVPGDQLKDYPGRGKSGVQWAYHAPSVVLSKFKYRLMFQRG